MQLNDVIWFQTGKHINSIYIGLEKLVALSGIPDIFLEHLKHTHTL